MNRTPGAPIAPVLAEEVALHALAWLVAGCAVGLLLSLLLAWPAGNALLAPLTYGRWMPVHLDVLLYGWTALPLVGMLCALYLPGEAGVRRGRLALTAWSGALATGVVSTLAGQSSGKLFLEWRGPASALFLAALALLWLLLASGFTREVARGPRRPPATQLGRALLLGLLAGVPVAMGLAFDPASYPPVDPTTGGPTGTDLAASTAALLPVLLGAPALLGLRRVRATPRPAPLWIAAVVYAAAVPLFGLGDRSHAQPAQIAAVASVLAWPWPLGRFWLAHDWPAGSRRWLAALGVWGGLLAASAVVTYLPGVLDRVKFTHALVAHAHLAMAGFSSSVAALVLHVLLRDSPARDILAAPRAFRLWHGGNALHVGAMAALGALEAGDPALLFRSDARVAALFALRGAAGAAMALAALGWLRGVARAASSASQSDAEALPAATRSAA